MKDFGNLASCFDQCIPFHFGQKRLNEIRVELRLFDFKCDVLENEREVVCVALFCVTGEKIVCYKANHVEPWSLRDEGHKSSLLRSRRKIKSV